MLERLDFDSDPRESGIRIYTTLVASFSSLLYFPGLWGRRGWVGDVFIFLYLYLLSPG